MRDSYCSFETVELGYRDRKESSTLPGQMKNSIVSKKKSKPWATTKNGIHAYKDQQ